ncbi:MAG: NAD(P)(+) transhydrogenase (Re/Si-specific) subunit beta [Acidobacteriota bacterium]
MSQALLDLFYLVASVLFIVGLRQLSSPKTAAAGNSTAALGMLVAVVATMIHQGLADIRWIIVAVAVGTILGALLAARIQMTAMPQLVALFNGLGGAASALVAGAELVRPHLTRPEIATTLPIALGVLIGTVTLTGSVVAFAKLQGLLPGRAIRSRLLPVVNALLTVVVLILTGALLGAPHQSVLLLALAVSSGILGVSSVMGIGGADMPVVIALLNALSGLAASATGFALSNDVLIVSGSLVGASGIILTQIMCKGMNRSLSNVLFSGFGAAPAGGGSPAAGAADVEVVGHSVDEAAIVLNSARLVIIVPGYGLAVAQAQHTVRELADELEKRDIEVQYGIHPVAGRMPGHMNVLLAEANVPYENLKDLDEVNPLFPQADVALIVGANDVVNPLARTDAGSPIYGMPILDVDKAGTCMVLKRSMRPGFSGIANPLYTQPGTMMIFGDAKETLVQLVSEVKHL